ncbi:MAG: hypothetical protein K9W43_10630 [Candidatus Thorarchaeota archaeon]|nr:hypothetical protein [Candidatus Thorarchaeota archaeon]
MTQYIFSRSDPSYVPLDYVVDLESGKWHVVVTEISHDLQIKIIVANDDNFTDIIAMSGTGRGNFPNVTFDITETSVLRIRVEENSENGTTSGAFNIGVLDSEHLATLTTSTSLPPLPPQSPLAKAFILSAGLVVILAFGFYVFNSVRRISDSQFVPIHIIEKHDPETAPDAILELPDHCPSCGHLIGPADIEWVGVHEVRCVSCGSVFHTATGQT